MFDTLIKHDKNREILDFYATDRRATTELLKRETFRKVIYEPACGQGHIGKILEEWGYKVKAEDIRHRGYGNGKEVDRKSTRLNSSHANISYAVFCLKKKN